MGPIKTFSSNLNKGHLSSQPKINPVILNVNTRASATFLDSLTMCFFNTRRQFSLSPLWSLNCVVDALVLTFISRKRLQMHYFLFSFYLESIATFHQNLSKIAMIPGTQSIELPTTFQESGQSYPLAHHELQQIHDSEIQ